MSVPELVVRATDTAARAGFAHSCAPEHGALLAALAATLPPGARIGEAGTGCGVGLAWLVSAGREDVEHVSVEADPRRATLCRELFAGVPRVTLLEGDWTALAEHAPFDLLCLDVAPASKEPYAGPDTADWLTPGGLVVLDDFSDADEEWPPTHDGRLDRARLWWTTHPALDLVEVRVRPAGPGRITLIGSRTATGPSTA